MSPRVLMTGVVGVGLWLAAATAYGQGAPPRPPQSRVLVVSGAAGSEEYAARQKQWRETLVTQLTTRLGVPASRVTVLAEQAGEGLQASTAVNLRQALATLKAAQGADDTLLIVLFGHGTFDGVDAKFNLVGPDLTARDWRDALQGMPGRVVFVQTASASFPFLAALSAPNRVVVTATDSPQQKYDTVFGEHFVAAFTPEAAESDLDKDGRISIWEAFAYAADASKRYYQQRGQLSVERALLDDTGDGVGRDLAKAGDDGLLASRVFLDPDPATATGDPSVTLLIGRRNTLETELDELRRKKGFMPDDAYARELERIIVDIARTSRDIRRRLKS
ncbi:hypothetical protein TBR22_A21240 [Luteitalea sp. TBR-22]|uniref:hypothetical protein n=1 Tax=Luteitalea sp. TBR-22 TaxID=2802971 RepID=UPI001EF45337|nr:hypothetical protein [Luteitalea sp. TBR-22]BCS32900.2 hypothetical protein TBR22_A21240 [Luteitalea sp. TBR-22]